MFKIFFADDGIRTVDHWSLVSKATALPTEPQTLPNQGPLFSQKWEWSQLKN